MGILRELVGVYRAFWAPARKKPLKPPPQVVIRPYIPHNTNRKGFFWTRCDKCSKLFRNPTLTHHEDIDEWLCSTCSNLLKIYRGED
jgi:hypothetical protein